MDAYTRNIFKDRCPYTDADCLLKEVSVTSIEKIKKNRYNQGYYDGYKKATEHANECIENIKAEIKQWYWQADKQAIAKDPCVVDAMVDLFIRTIDKHTSPSDVERGK